MHALIINFKTLDILCFYIEQLSLSFFSHLLSIYDDELMQRIFIIVVKLFIVACNNEARDKTPIFPTFFKERFI